VRLSSEAVKQGQDIHPIALGFGEVADNQRTDDEGDRFVASASEVGRDWQWGVAFREW